MKDTSRIGILGGTFDPVHLGHLHVAVAVLEALDLDEVLLVPAHDPPHRPSLPFASTYHRFAMLALAVAGRKGLLASDLELSEPGPSYTARTLSGLNASGCSPLQLFFITGSDAFAEIATWKDYPAFLESSNFVAVSRPGLPAANLRGMLPQLAPRMLDLDLKEKRTGPSAEVSSPAVFLVDIVTPDVSSTAVRSRVKNGQPLTGLVPEAVEGHIRRHGLYLQHVRPSWCGPAVGDLHEQ
jgi:nicotinate-nucleotide adenylyltransferase